MEQSNTSQKRIGILSGLAVILFVTVVTIFYEIKLAAAPSDAAAFSIQTTSSTTNPSSAPPQPVNAPVVSAPPPATVPKQTASVYTDGTYTAIGSYMSPGGQEQIKVAITLANDIITNASVTSLAYDGTSQRYQRMFISGYKQYVIGKNIADVHLTYVSGSSLTPAGFDSALTQIESQAKA